jgi:hypothetical protein
VLTSGQEIRAVFIVVEEGAALALWSDFEKIEIRRFL